MSLAILSFTALSMIGQVASTASTSCAEEPVVAGWYTSTTPLSDVSWDKYNTLYFSFAMTTQSVHNLTLDAPDPLILNQFVNQAHEHGVSAQLSVGGWGGSRFFSTNVATAENRTAFVETISEFVTQYKLDGIDFDWEYPNKQGIGCNAISANDTENFLLFLEELREHPVGAQMTLSASVPLAPFNDATGSPSADMSGFAELLDYIKVMNYDVFGSWSSAVGPNSPLNDTCAPSADQVGSAVSAVKAWGAAGVQPNKIVLGTASYGHSFSVKPQDAFVSGSKTALAAYPKFNASNQPLGDTDNSSGGKDVCGVQAGPGGTFTFKGLISHNFLDASGNPAPGIFYRFDECSQTAYVYSETTEVMISFDDAKAFAAKGKFVKEAGLAGFSMWQVGNDYDNLLLDAIRSGAEFDTAQTRKRNWNWNL